jgi:CHASE2 domain-containing sensor protein
MRDAHIRRAVRRDIVMQALLLSVLLTGMVWALYVVVRGTVYQVYENLSYPRFLDFGYQIRSAARDMDVVIVSFDRLPVDRLKLAQGIARVKQLHPKVVGIDILLDSTGHPGDDELAAELRTDVPMVLACEFEGSRVVMPDSMFLPPNVHTGHAHLRLSVHDQIVRWFTTFDRHGDRSFPSFTAQMAYAGGVPVIAQFPPGANYLINYAGEYAQFGYVTVNELLAWKDTMGLATLIRDHYVLFGYCADARNDAPLFRDLFQTPFTASEGRSLEGRMYGVEVHANILHTIVNGRRIREWGELPGVLIAVGLAFINLLCQNLFVRISLKNRRKLFWLALGLEFIALVTIPLALFVLTDQTIDVTIPLIATLILPKAQELYYRYIDNIGLPFRRRWLRHLPVFVTEPFLKVYEASSLGDRLGAAITTAAILSPLSRHLLDNGAIADESCAERLEWAVEDLDDVMERGRRILALYQGVHGSHVAAIGENGTGRPGEGIFEPKPVHMEVKVDPLQGYGAYYEHFFLEVMVVVDHVLGILRQALRHAPLNAGLHGDHDEITLNAGDKTVGLSPFVRRAICVRHGAVEYFVRSSPWVNATETPGVSGHWIGPTTECFRNGSSSHAPALQGGGHAVHVSK